MSIYKQHLLPINLISLLRNLANNFERKTPQSDKWNGKENSSLLFNPGNIEQSSSNCKVLGKWIKNRELTNFLKKYKLGYNSIRYQFQKNNIIK
jgi:hypothetical protein